MGPFAAGDIVLIPFPFSDLTDAKRRPAVLLGEAGKGDWIMCMVTSNPFADPKAVRIDRSDFESGSLSIVSYARPGKLFTANDSLVVAEVGKLNTATHRRVPDAVVQVLVVP